MRIITPSGAAMSPGGSGGGSPIEISYTYSGVATGNIVVGAFEIGPLPTTGPYMMVLYLETTNATASAGVLSVNLVYDLAIAFNPTLDLTVNGPSLSPAEWPIYNGLSVLLDWNITLFGAGSTDFKIIASATKLFS